MCVGECRVHTHRDLPTHRGAHTYIHIYIHTQIYTNSCTFVPQPHLPRILSFCKNYRRELKAVSGVYIFICTHTRYIYIYIHSIFRLEGILEARNDLYLYIPLCSTATCFCHDTKIMRFWIQKPSGRVVWLRCAAHNQKQQVAKDTEVYLCKFICRVKS